MKKWLKTLLPVAGAVAAAAALTALVVAPGRSSEDQKAPFIRRNYAHRGLHKLDKSVPENSLSAFREAAEAGYGVELDVHLSKDEEVMVFHDDTLDRMCGVPGNIEEKTCWQLKQLRLAGTEETIPTLKEAFDAIDGRVPVILELKSGSNNRLLCEKTLALMDDYHGQVCIESFDPLIVRWFHTNAPDILRGQLSCEPGRFSEDTKKPVAFLLGNLLTNFLSRPQFIAYGIGGKKPLTVRICEALGAMRVAWTSHDMEQERKNDAVIFEFYRPGREY